MTRIKSRLAELFYSDFAATSTEYAVMIALIILVCFASITILGDKVSDTFVDANNGLPDVSAN